MSKPHVTVDDDGFSFCNRGEVEHRVLWSDVQEIFAYKQDRGIVDSIWLSFRLRDESALDIEEEVSDFQALRSAIEQRFAINQSWWSTVAFPAFATNLIRLWPTNSEVADDSSQRV